MVCLDYAATSPPFPEILSEYSRVAADIWGNPGSLHSAGTRTRILLQDSRKTLARLLQVRPEEICFTSGATEANNWAVKMICAQSRRRHIACSAAEHPSVLAAVRSLQASGFSCTLVNPDPQGRILPESVARALRPDTALLCVQAVNNETGVVQDVDALATLARSRGVPYFCDAVQSFGHVRQNLHKTDLFSLSAHKFGGPLGVGCLVVRQPHTLSPLLDGGGQEFGLRSGTENLPAIAGLSLAAELSAARLDSESLRLAQLMQQLQSGLKALCPQLQIAGEQAVRSPGILCCAFPGISGEEMAIRLSRQDICVSPGAACSARNSKPSHVLLSMGYSPKEAAGFLRFSLGAGTTEEEIRQTIHSIAHIIS